MRAPTPRASILASSALKPKVERFTPLMLFPLLSPPAHSELQAILKFTHRLSFVKPPGSHPHRNMTIGSRRSKYGSLNWGEHKSMLERLYMDEDKTLAEVAMIMKDDYGFAPR